MSNRKRDIEAYLRTANSETLPVLIGMPEDSLGTLVYGEGEGLWSIRDVVSHLADAEAGLLGQVRRLLAGEETVPAHFDLDRWNRSAVRRKRDRTYPQLLDDIRTAFAEALATLEATDDEILTAEGYFRRMADHRRQHVADIHAALTGPGFPTDSGRA
jgi:uncharacterized damage-inducible protein DinB